MSGLGCGMSSIGANIDADGASMLIGSSMKSSSIAGEPGSSSSLNPSKGCSDMGLSFAGTVEALSAWSKILDCLARFCIALRSERRHFLGLLLCLWQYLQFPFARFL